MAVVVERYPNKVILQILILVLIVKSGQVMRSKVDRKGDGLLTRALLGKVWILNVDLSCDIIEAARYLQSMVRKEKHDELDG
jgi:hypothetical protein